MLREARSRLRRARHGSAHLRQKLKLGVQVSNANARKATKVGLTETQHNRDKSKTLPYTPAQPQYGLLSVTRSGNMIRHLNTRTDQPGYSYQATKPMDRTIPIHTTCGLRNERGQPDIQDMVQLILQEGFPPGVRGIHVQTR